MRRLQIRADRAVSLALRIAEASSEHELFVAMLDAIETIRGRSCFRAYVVDPQKRSVRLSADFGYPKINIIPEQVENWLLHDGPVPHYRDGLEKGMQHTCAKLVSGNTVLGGVFLAFLESENEVSADQVNSHLMTEFARLGASSLVALRKRRLSTMVLEALEQSEEAIVFYGEDDEGVIFSNDAYHRVFPHYPNRQELLGRTHLDLYRMDLAAGIISDPLAHADPEAYLQERKLLAEQLVDTQREIQKLGNKTYIYTRTRSEAGAIMSRRIDITEQALAEARLRQREKQLQSLVYIDSLTGLNNRAHFLEYIEELSRRMKDGDLEAVTVFWIDLNGFKIVNDTYGHTYGDSVLRKVGLRMQMGMPEKSEFVRYGGDEFVMVFEEQITAQKLEILANRILTIVNAPINHDGTSFQLGASIGIAHTSGRDADLSSLLGNADLAMYEAKKQSRCSFKVFDPKMRSSMIERCALIDDIKLAFEQDQFELYYQPQFDTRSGVLVGFEALTRWNHPVRGFVPPDLFIPIMEETNMIEQLGRWCLQEACKEASHWPKDLFVAVNVSPLQLKNPHFALTIGRALAHAGLRAEQLELEITESVLLDGNEGERCQIETWKKLGIQVALDDVGKGYSSLSYLSQFPFDKIKIDRSFLKAFDAEEPEDASAVILHAIVELGKTLGKTVIAEGVEREDQLEYLRSVGCDQAQGYLLGRPMCAQDARKFVRKFRLPLWKRLRVS
ncbi:EAL domain-containing protein [uncultured Cohaesibacter sp.]|uniref:putative bifunctional diguanylate cyclase/phosphodiesterase n=1 Tax=uncultured Cohaesibacter sp. TaxID=1002546 RepID=UPI0029C8BD38|nr:EAL domain-containing protein [uncultured Cohaesibacter sp.]